jgi:hypothetical protein
MKCRPIGQAVQRVAPGYSPSALIAPRMANEAAKSYAVGLEISCPRGAYDWAPKSPARGE